VCSAVSSQRFLLLLFVDPALFAFVLVVLSDGGAVLPFSLECVSVSSVQYSHPLPRYTSGCCRGVATSLPSPT
jgi:hypothetical protein